jgi:hypothetical protein
VLDEAGDVLMEQRLSTTPKAIKEIFGAIPRSVHRAKNAQTHPANGAPPVYRPFAATGQAMMDDTETIDEVEQDSWSSDYQSTGGSDDWGQYLSSMAIYRVMPPFEADKVLKKLRSGSRNPSLLVTRL